MKRLVPKLRRAAQAVLLLTTSIGIAMLLAEGLVRLVAPQQLIVLRPDIWQPVEGVGWRHRANADTVINTGDGPARIMTDDRGHRIGPEGTHADPEVRILALGDSFLEAIQVDHEDTFADGIERRLRADLGTSTRVVNTGVGGWSPEQYRIEASDELDRAAYDAMLVFFYLPNDRLYGRRESFPPRQAAGRRKWRVPRSFAKREWVDGIAYPINDVLERRSHLFTLLKHQGKFLLMRLGLSAHYFPTVLERNGTAAEAKAWQSTIDALSETRALAQAHGMPMLVVFLPGLYQVDAAIGDAYAQAVGHDTGDYDLELPSRLLGGLLDAEGIPFLDLLPILRQALADGRGPLYGSVDTHFAPAGHDAVAEAVTPHVLQMLRAGTHTDGIDTAGDDR